MCVWILLYVAFCTIMAISRQKEARAETMPYSYFEWLQGFFIMFLVFIVHSTIGSSVRSRPLNILEHCIWTATMTNTRPDRNSSLVPPDYKPQSIRMSHQGRPPICLFTWVKDSLLESKVVTFPQNLYPATDDPMRDDVAFFRVITLPNKTFKNARSK